MWALEVTAAGGHNVLLNVPYATHLPSLLLGHVG